ncbi:MAG: glycosyltransferase family 2 protein, partial [Patescibacteria group bacterium]|nr:glycosyltransferase family 2 protein [Patescibacteria group bacterium]
MDICITIVNTKEKEEIKKCLLSFYKDSADSGLNFCVVIVDNNSDESIQEIKEMFPNLKIILQKKNEGFGKSHNKAIKSEIAHYYFILNPDTVFPKNNMFLRKMYDFMEANPRVGIIGPKILYPDNSLQYSCYRFPTFLQPLYSRTKFGKSAKGKKIIKRFLMKDFSHNKTLPVDWVMGSAMFARARAIEEVGAFDDRFWMYAEDSDWCRRMWEKGWLVYYVHDIVIQHVYGRVSARVPGVFNALFKNRYARVHIWSWLKYFWKWKKTNKYV